MALYIPIPGIPGITPGVIPIPIIGIPIPIIPIPIPIIGFIIGFIIIIGFILCLAPWTVYCDCDCDWDYGYSKIGRDTSRQV